MRLWALQAVIILALLAICLAAAQLPRAQKKTTDRVQKVCAAVGYDANDINRALCYEFSGER